MREGDVIVARFRELFGADGMVRIIRSPGRVNLIGEHTDYNDGFVLPMAIEPQVMLAARSRGDGVVRLASAAFAGDIVQFSLEGKIEPGEPAWANYVRGVAAQLIAAGIPLAGMDALITNSLPVGGGLSSSAALEVGAGLAFLTLAGLEMDRMRLAMICQKAEHDYAMVPCGLMDQMIVATARAGHATLFDCREQTRQSIAIDPRELCIIIVNSMVRHELSAGEYARRRRECQEAVAHFRQGNPAVAALRDVTAGQLDEAEGRLEATLLKRARHVVSENQRTLAAAAALTKRHYEEAGQLMVQSHASLRDDYQVSCQELDFLAEQAMGVKGVYGARMTGGGFGGCIVALAQPRARGALEQHLVETYAKRFDRQAAVIATVAAGAADAA